MGPHLRKLLSIACPALSEQPPTVEPKHVIDAGSLADEYAAMLRVRNSFYAFESALHVFPAGTVERGYSLAAWNDPTLWTGEYGDLLAGAVCFAEDVFAEQFVLIDGGVHRLDPEIGELSWIAASLEEWAGQILADYEFETGWTTASEWQGQHGPLPIGHRLIPKTPFVLGGEYDIDNLYAADPVEAMRFRAYLAGEIRDLPNGAQIEFKIVD
jgi:hypothetical protein